MTILNLTQHKASQAQIAAGVIEPANKDVLTNLLTFEGLPTREEVVNRAREIANFAVKVEEHVGLVMIGGAPYLMSVLEEALISVGCTPLYAFSERDSIEEVLDDGTTVKRTVFVHKGFVGVR